MSVGSFKSLPKTQQTLSRPSGSSRAISPGEHRVILHIDPLIPRGDSPTEKSVKSPVVADRTWYAKEVQYLAPFAFADRR